MSGRAPLIWLVLIAVGGVAFYVGRETAPPGEPAPDEDLLDADEGAEAKEPRRGPMLHPAERPPPAATDTDKPAPEPVPEPVAAAITVDGEGDDAVVHVPEGTLRVARKKSKYVLVRHGAWVEKRKDGHLIRAHYSNGRLVGVWRAWHPNGHLGGEAEYTDGVLDGFYRTFHANGKPEEAKTYVKGKLHGRESTWHKNGTLATLGFHETGKKHGVWATWDENGTKRTEVSWRMGQVQGNVVQWDETGALVTDAYLEDKATVKGKYRGLLRRVHAAKDKKSYGDFRDYGKYSATDYAGEKAIPAGYWVYAYPYWFIWAEQVEKK